ncbi:MAG: MATE family efflux transporter [Sphaerochaetaceae bacterium]|nr:MATE family efflux transporter [Sphaerochaetaceae bacterium]
MESKDNSYAAKYKRLTEAPVSKLIPSLAVPTIISMLVTALYNATDTFFVGRISTSATAAVGLCFSVMAILQAVGFFCGQGSGSFLSRALGAGKKEEAEQMSATGFALAFILGLVTCILLITFVEPVSYFLGASVTTIENTVSYLSIIAIGAPLVMTQCVMNNQLRFQGSAIYAMAGLLSGAIFNIILDPVLIFGLNMGVRGAATATVCGQAISFVVLYIGTGKGGNIRPMLKNIRFNRHYLLEIVNGGSPSLVRQGLMSISSIMMNRMAGMYGDAAIAGMSINTRVMMFVSSALIGFGQGYQPVSSFNYGAGKKERVREGYFFCVKWGTLFLTVMAILCEIYAPQIIRIFRDDDAVVAVGQVALRFQAAALPLQATIVITNMMLQSTGKGVKASITASARSGLFFIPAILILPQFLGLLGVEMAQAVADVLALSISIPMAASELNKMK